MDEPAFLSEAKIQMDEPAFLSAAKIQMDEPAFLSERRRFKISAPLPPCSSALFLF
jgi:hypothetical protein